ncbi:MAG TPA: CHRD domain-containing protein [Steroidobacteraceae bacterium]|nr:CHRD domain-containing protein [Steroidobacteraceae bacterium]
MRALMTLAGVLVATAITACGGYGGSNYSSSSGGTSCGAGYQAMCPPPTVSVTAPTSGVTVSGTVALTATAAAASGYTNITIASVEFLVDGTSVGTAMASPYTVNWDTTTATNGSHTITAKATDSMNDSTTSQGVMVTVMNGAMAAAMSPAQVFPTPSSKASGVARIGIDSDTGAVTGTVTLSGMSARAVTINQGFAGSTGEAVVTLAPRAGRPGEFVVPPNVVLSSAQAGALAQGRLYVIATSDVNPNGEIRGQLAPGSVRVTFSALEASPEAAAQGLSASGVAATTVDTRAGTLTVHVNTAGVEDATAARVLSGAAGTALAELARSPVEMGHFSTELAPISAADVESFEAGRLSVSVATPAAPAGALRGAISPEAATAGN